MFNCKYFEVVNAVIGEVELKHYEAALVEALEEVRKESTGIDIKEVERELKVAEKALKVAEAEWERVKDADQNDEEAAAERRDAMSNLKNLRSKVDKLTKKREECIGSFKLNLGDTDDLYAEVDFKTPNDYKVSELNAEINTESLKVSKLEADIRDGVTGDERKHIEQVIKSINELIKDKKMLVKLYEKEAEKEHMESPRICMAISADVYDKQPGFCMTAYHQVIDKWLAKIGYRKSEIKRVGVWYNPKHIVSASRLVGKITAKNAVKRQGTPTQRTIEQKARAGEWDYHDLADMVSSASWVFACFGEFANTDVIEAESRCLGEAATKLSKIAVTDKAARVAVINGVSDSYNGKHYKEICDKMVCIERERREHRDEKRRLDKMAEELLLLAVNSKVDKSNLKKAVDAERIARDELKSAKKSAFYELAESDPVVKAYKGDAYIDWLHSMDKQIGEKIDSIAQMCIELNDAEFELSGAEARYAELKRRNGAITRLANKNKQMHNKCFWFKPENIDFGDDEKIAELKELIGLVDNKELKANLELLFSIALGLVEYTNDLDSVDTAYDYIELVGRVAEKAVMMVVAENMEKVECHKSLLCQYENSIDRLKEHIGSIVKRKETACSELAEIMDSGYDYDNENYKKALSTTLTEIIKCYNADESGVLYSNRKDRFGEVITEKMDVTKCKEVKEFVFEKIKEFSAKVHKATADCVNAENTYRKAVEVETAYQKRVNADYLALIDKANAEQRKYDELSKELAQCKELERKIRREQAVSNAVLDDIAIDKTRLELRERILEVSEVLKISRAKGDCLCDMVSIAEEITGCAYMAINQYLTDLRSIGDKAKTQIVSINEVGEYVADPSQIVDGDFKSEYDIRKTQYIGEAWSKTKDIIKPSELNTIKALFKTNGDTVRAKEIVGVSKQTLFNHRSAVAKVFTNNMVIVAPESFERRACGLRVAANELTAELAIMKLKEEEERRKANKAKEINAEKAKERLKEFGEAVKQAELDADLRNAVADAYMELSPVQIKVAECFIDGLGVRDTERFINVDHRTVTRSKKIITDKLLKAASRYGDAVKEYAEAIINANGVTELLKYTVA